MSGALRSWLSTTYGGQVRDIESPRRITDGFDFRVYFVHVGGDGLPAEWSKPVVVRVAPAVARFPMLERETRIQRWCADLGYPAPAPIALLPPGTISELPAQVVQWVPGRTAAAAMAGAPWQLPTLVSRLARLQAALHNLPTPAWADAGAPEWDLAETRLRLVRHVVNELDAPDLAAALRAIEELLPRVQPREPVICHGDFHPMNVLVAGRQASVIDWTDAGIGDRHGDLARTLLIFELAAVAAARPGQRALLRAVNRPLAAGYLRAYTRRLPVDPQRLRLWTPIHLIQLWAQAEADEQELFGPTRQGDRFRAGLAGLLHAWFERVLTPEIAALAGSG